MDTFETVPACSEDAIIVKVNGHWACGPAADDGIITHDGTCDAAIGTGSFDNGTWTAYECAAFSEYDTVSAPMAQPVASVAQPEPIMLPDTAMDVGADWTLALVLPLVVAVASIARAVRQII